ncbi:F0F1 ATP synthase subunit B family protein [Oceanomicrobium pacificus]|uniref:ATP synthase subunit b n=1 Tax=Oceanomicrobium pacificus TaxID=2692916 RepID=A0A6B0TJU8_9RHOB|nr:ATP F0F1 synthase subunit B [Oceanomicrobium pacificus]MXU64136.1 ATP F0F1 synthase subunit B [Oceanomicrobium pacificus]
MLYTMVPLAGDYPFLSLNNTNTVVLIAFVIFVGVLLYFKVPGKAAEALDKRAEGIRKDLEEARALRDEAQALLASFERKHKDVAKQTDDIVAAARTEAQLAADEARSNLTDTIARRLKAAEEQIEAAEARAVREVRDQAISVATAAAADVIAKNLSKDEADALVDAAIKDAGARLH